MVPGTAFSLYDGEILGCGGIIELSDDDATVWMILSDALRARPFLLHRTAVKTWRLILRSSCHRRFYATAVADHLEGHRWLQRLGFAKDAEAPILRSPSNEALVRYKYERN